MAAPGASASAGSASSAQAVQAERKVTWSKGDSDNAAGKEGLQVVVLTTCGCLQPSVTLHAAFACPGNLAASLNEKLTISQGMRPGRLQPDSPGVWRQQ